MPCKQEVRCEEQIRLKDVWSPNSQFYWLIDLRSVSTFLPIPPKKKMNIWELLNVNLLLPMKPFWVLRVKLNIFNKNTVSYIIKHVSSYIWRLIQFNPGGKLRCSHFLFVSIRRYRQQCIATMSCGRFR